MTNDEYGRVCNILKANFPRITIFDTGDSSSHFFNVLNRYNFKDTWKGILQCVDNFQYPPSLREIISTIEKAESERRMDERRQANASQTWSESVKCPKCNDAGFVMIRREDGTDSIRPCNCDTGREKFPWAFMDDDEWKQTVEEQRRKGKFMSMDRPGEPSSFFEEHCGGIVELKPGNRPPSRSQKWKQSQTATEKPKNGAYIDFTCLLEENPT